MRFKAIYRQLFVAAILSLPLLGACDTTPAPAAAQSAIPPRATTCAQFADFSRRYDRLASDEQSVITAAEASVDAHRRDVAQYHAAWAALGADLSAFASRIRELSRPPEISGDVDAIAEALDAQAVIAQQFSMLPAATIVANFPQYEHATGVRDGAITHMSFDLGLAKGIAGCE